MEKPQSKSASRQQTPPGQAPSNKLPYRSAYSSQSAKANSLLADLHTHLGLGYAAWPRSLLRLAHAILKSHRLIIMNHTMRIGAGPGERKATTRSRRHRIAVLHD